MQRGSCVCLHNVSHHLCDICVSRVENYDECSEAQANTPLWFIAVILPVFFVLIIAALLVVVIRRRRENARCQQAPEKTQQGSDNIMFCFDDCKRPRVLVPPVDLGQLSNVTRPDQQRSKVQPLPKNDVEYYEVGSNCSPFHSHTASLRLSWQSHQNSPRCIRTDPKRWADLKTSGGLKTQRFGEDQNSPTMRHNVISLHEQLLIALTDCEQRQETKRNTKMSLKPELVEPVQGLTFEEISKLNISGEAQECCRLNRVSPKLEKLKSAVMTDVSSENETDSTFTCSDSECRQNSDTVVRKFIPDQSVCSFRQRGVCPVHSGLTCPADSHTLCASFELWENVLNMHPDFCTFAGVFEDIARLPIETIANRDMQSEIEEII